MIAPGSTTPGKMKTSTSMSASLENRLSAFNRQVQPRQDEAYTLAYYLLGSPELAAQAVQSACLQAFHQSGSSPKIDRLSLLRLVLGCCNGCPGRPLSTSDPDIRLIFSLPSEERCAVLLIDVLGLSYAEAAQVLGCKPARLSQWLAQGRVRAI
jgi:DNA-directed RNA polymerase specialized sigma24 family protein